MHLLTPFAPFYRLIWQISLLFHILHVCIWWNLYPVKCTWRMKKLLLSGRTSLLRPCGRKSSELQFTWGQVRKRREGGRNEAHKTSLLIKLPTDKGKKVFKLIWKSWQVIKNNFILISELFYKNLYNSSHAILFCKDAGIVYTCTT